MHSYISLLLLIALVIVLYKEILKPSIAFTGLAFIFILLNIISVDEFLQGLANKQIIIIFLLIVLTSGIQKNLGTDIFYKIFKTGLSPNEFRIKMMVLVGSLSAVLNNTPIVAFMVPYVKDWAKSNNYPASKFLIPLSFATILGGTVTVVGTSTNLVLNGLLSQYKLPLLGFTDFLFLGLLVSTVGILYLGFTSNFLLPERADNKDNVIQHLNEYLIETYVPPKSTISGKTVREAGLRNLKEVYLVEISRNNQVITPVSPNDLILEGDQLYFTGNYQTLLQLIQKDIGLNIPEHSHIYQNSFSELIEAVVPSSSALIGEKIMNTDFRNRFQGSILSIYRKGEQVKGNIGEIRMQAGDLLLMLIGSNKVSDKRKDLIIINRKGELENNVSGKSLFPSVVAIAFLLLGIVGVMDLFIAVVFGIFTLIISNIINLSLIRKAVDIDLLAILISSLAIGVALKNSGAAGFLVEAIFQVSYGSSPFVSLVLLFLMTLVLTSMITNAAAVSIMFPIALEMGMQLGTSLTPYFVAIAFAASGDFMTPIGYQTNLMVMGPGNYKFKDFFRIGFPLTVIYSLICLLFIYFFYIK